MLFKYFWNHPHSFNDQPIRSRALTIDLLSINITYYYIIVVAYFDGNYILAAAYFVLS